MKKRPKPCIKTLAILGCVAAVILSATAVVADGVVTRLMQAVRDAPDTAAAPEPAAPPPP
jgi:hypothetical protein